MRRALTWIVALPLIVAGSQVAHGLAYWWAYPVAGVREAILQRSGHGYESYTPTVVGFLAAVELLVLAAAVADGVRRNSPGRGLPAWAFLWLPAIGFTLQEHLERFLSAGVFPWWTVQEPTFWRGLVLQIPLGLLAYAIARLLLRTVDAVAGAFGAQRRAAPRRRLRPHVSTRWQSLLLPRSAPLALAAAGRAPPLPLR